MSVVKHLQKGTRGSSPTMTAPSAAVRLQKGRLPLVLHVGRTQSRKPSANHAMAVSVRAAAMIGVMAATATSTEMIGIKVVVASSNKDGGDPKALGSKGIAPEAIGSDGKAAAPTAKAAGKARAALGAMPPVMSAVTGATGAD